MSARTVGIQIRRTALAWIGLALLGACDAPPMRTPEMERQRAEVDAADAAYINALGWQGRNLWPGDFVHFDLQNFCGQPSAGRDMTFRARPGPGGSVELEWTYTALPPIEQWPGTSRLMRPKPER